jgi:integrase
MKKPMRIDLGQGRGNKRRGTGHIGKDNIALYDTLAAAYKRRKTPYVIEYRGKKIATIDLSKAYRRAGLVGFTRRQHLLKHTCCSWLVQGGASYEEVAKLVGTKSSIIEKHYGHLSPQHMATVGNLLTVSI